MKKAYLELGYACNNFCKHCFVPQTQMKRDLNTDEIKGILDRLENEGYSVVAFTGGEPTLRRDLFELVRYARSIGLENIELQTNGRILYYADYAKQIKKMNFSKVGLSIHSHKKKQHEYLTQAQGSWEQTVQGIKNAIKFGIPLMTNTVISRINYTDIEDTVIMLSKLGVKEIELDFIRFIGNAEKYFPVLSVRMSDIWPFLRKTFDHSAELPLEMIYIDDYPLCLMNGYEKFNADSFGEGVHDEDAMHFNTDFKGGESIHKNEKIYTNKCGVCAHRGKCQGIWKEYLKHFGDKEFRPVRYLHESVH